MTLRKCPNCSCDVFLPWRRRSEIRREVSFRTAFVQRHFDHKPEPAELMDLTRFMHGRSEPLVRCAACGLILRDESRAASYTTDFYDGDLLQQLYPRYLQAFRAKGVSYRNLLPPQAEVIEMGSHIGAFLEAAEEWDWRPTGLDIGEYSSAFARARGLRVKRESLTDSSRPHRGADALFIWNCFEQLEDPGETLLAARTVLKPHGILTVRVPNFAFYERARALAKTSALRSLALRDLAYNNLLAFPYLAGYTPAKLITLLRGHGFQPLAGFNSTLLTMPFPDLTRRVEQEMTAAYRPYSDPAPQPLRLDAPWIEVACSLIPE